MIKNARELLACLAVMFDNNFELMYKAIKERIPITDAEYVNFNKSIKGDYLTIIDDDYPQILKESPQPPLVLFFDEEDRKKINDQTTDKFVPPYKELYLKWLDTQA